MTLMINAHGRRDTTSEAYQPYSILSQINSLKATTGEETLDQAEAHIEEDRRDQLAGVQ